MGGGCALAVLVITAMLCLRWRLAPTRTPKARAAAPPPKSSVITVSSIPAAVEEVQVADKGHQDLSVVVDRL